MSNVNPVPLFPSDSANVSNEFTVTDSHMALIQLKEIPDCTSLLIEYHFGIDCDFSWEPVIWCDNEQMRICYPQTQYILPIPGRYRLVLVDENDEHIEDPDLYENVRIQMRPISPLANVSKYYGLCCECCDQ